MIDTQDSRAEIITGGPILKLSDGPANNSRICYLAEIPELKDIQTSLDATRWEQMNIKPMAYLIDRTKMSLVPIFRESMFRGLAADILVWRRQPTGYERLTAVACTLTSKNPLEIFPPEVKDCADPA